MASALDQLLAKQPRLLQQILAGSATAEPSPELTYPAEAEPSILDVFLQDLQGTPGRLYDQFIGQPLTALDVLGSAITSENKVPVTEDEFIQQMIQKGELPPRPEWTKDFVAPKRKAMTPR